MSDAPSIEALEAVHEFPGPFAFKAFGPHDQEFVDAVKQAVERAITDPSDVDYSARPSSKGKHVCITVTARFESAAAVRGAYIHLKSVDRLRMLL